MLQHLCTAVAFTPPSFWRKRPFTGCYFCVVLSADEYRPSYTRVALVLEKQIASNTVNVAVWI